MALFPPKMATVTPPAIILWIFLVSASTFLPVNAASNFSLVVSGPTMLQLSPSLIVESSPGLKPGAKVKCERVIVHGLPRVKHLSKFANSVKVKVSCLDPSGRPPNIDVCFHRNVSLGVGMCPQAHWERLTKGLWMKAMSPFDHKILDIRVGVSCSQSIEVSLDEAIIPSFGSSVDECGFLAQQVFRFLLQYCYGYGDLSCDINGTFPAGMKLLPTGRKSSLGIFLYSCFIGLGSFLLRYVPRLLRALLVEIGLSEDLYDPVSMLLLVFLVISGAWLGFWVVRKLVLAEDGSIDIGVSYFVTWSIRIVASVMILQSSVDPLLAVEALVGGIVISSWNPKVVYRVCKKLCRLNKISLRELLDPYSRLAKDPPVSTPYTKAPYTTRVRGSTLTSDSPKRLSDTKTFYSTFHETPDRKKFTKDEWESFTRESTRKALEGLVSSPDFSRWAVAHADRITLAPKKEISDKRRRWFHWF
ncbi:hypothetical protein OROMI_028668 [Orobanche minor]